MPNYTITFSDGYTDSVRDWLQRGELTGESYREFVAPLIERLRTRFPRSVVGVHVKEDKGGFAKCWMEWDYPEFKRISISFFVDDSASAVGLWGLELESHS